jgi:hypothetical protein
VTAQGIYKENHYVTQWYQRRFLPSTGEQKFRYLDLRPQTFVDAKGIKRQKKSLQRWGTDRCFKLTDPDTTMRLKVIERADIGPQGPFRFERRLPLSLELCNECRLLGYDTPRHRESQRDLNQLGFLLRHAPPLPTKLRDAIVAQK